MWSAVIVSVLHRQRSLSDTELVDDLMNVVLQTCLPNVTCSGKRMLLGSNLENELLVRADSAQSYLLDDDS
jgi:hypothetical protein